MHRRSFVFAVGAVLLSSCAPGTGDPGTDVLGEQQFGVRTAFGDPLPGLTADELALFGLGLVDATPDDELRSIAALQARLAPDVAGTVAIVPDLFSGKPGVGKFGWKNQNPTLLQFSADAYLNEMGITSPKFPDENCP